MGKVESSILVPTFNQVIPYLRAAIKSALLQTIPVEIIAIDDGSKEPQLKYVLAAAKELKLTVTYGETNGQTIGYMGEFPFKYFWQPNKGVAGALNTGIKMCSGDYIQWLPSDDLFMPAKTEIQMQALKASGLLVSYTAYEVSVPDYQITYAAILCPAHAFLYALLRSHCFINCGTFMWHRKVFEKLGLFNEKIVYAQDYEMALRCAESLDFCPVNVPLVRRRTSRTQLTQYVLSNKSELLKKQKDMEYLRERYGIYRAERPASESPEDVSGTTTDPSRATGTNS